MHSELISAKKNMKKIARVSYENEHDASSNQESSTVLISRFSFY